MALPSSGSISLSQVAVELGRSSTATTSLDESAVRTLAGVPSGTISLSNFYGKSNITYLFGQINPTISRTSITTWANCSIDYDSSGNIYLIFGDCVEPFIVKLNAQGVIQWQKVISPNSFGVPDSSYLASRNVRGFVNRSTNKLVIIIRTEAYKVWFAQYDLNGNREWSLATQYGLPYPSEGLFASDSSGGIYFASSEELRKYNSSGSLVWLTSMYSGGNTQFARYVSGIAVYGGTGYVAFTPSNGNNPPQFASFNTSTGGVSALTAIQGYTAGAYSPVSFPASRMTSNGAGQFIVLGNDIYNNNRGVITNTSGGIVSSYNMPTYPPRSVTGAGSDGSFYVASTIDTGSGVTGQQLQIHKLSSGGTSLWVRLLRLQSYLGVSAGFNVCSVTASSTLLYVSGMLVGSWNNENNAVPFFIVVPVDGSKTGSYTFSSTGLTWTYETYSVGTGIEAYTTGGSAGSGSRSETTGSLSATDTNSSRTSVTVTL